MVKKSLFLIIVSAIVFVWQVPLMAMLVTEATPTEPYEVTGQIEVEVDPFAPHPLEDCITILSIGLIRWQKGHFIKQKIRNKIKEKAKNYSADAVVNVKYFPDPAESSYLRNGVYVGKGDMIRYKRDF